MALPTDPIPRVAYDEIIEENWGDSVAQSINNSTEMFDSLVWKPDTEYLAPTAATPLGFWIRVGGTDGNITVPDWATHVIVNVALNGVYLSAQGVATYDVRVDVGPQSGRTIRRTIVQSRDRTSADNRDWMSLSWTDRLGVSSIEGDRAVRIYAGRFNGSQRWAVDTTSDIAVSLIFEGSSGGFANWYPGI